MDLFPQGLSSDADLLNVLLQPEHVLTDGSGAAGSTEQRDDSGELLSMPSLPGAAQMNWVNMQPLSWQDYLQPGSGPAAETRTQDADEATAGDLLAASRADKRKARNRSAMRRFRERQKVKAKEEQSRMEELESQLRQLQLEKAQLQDRCSKMEEEEEKRRQSADQTPDGSSADTSVKSDGPEVFEPCHGWQDFDPRSVMNLYWSPFSPVPIQLSQESMRAMSIVQLQALQAAYIAKSTPLVPLARAEPEGDAVRQLYGMKRELNALGANMSLNNPRQALWRFSDRSLDASCTMETVVERLQLSPCQEDALVEVHQLVSADILRLHKQRRSLLEQFQALVAGEAGDTPEKLTSYPTSQKLCFGMACCSEDLHRTICIYCATAWGEVLDGVQTAIVAAALQPHMNLWPLTEFLAARKTKTQTPEVKAVVAQQVEATYAWIERHKPRPRCPGGTFPLAGEAGCDRSQPGQCLLKDAVQ